MKDSTNQTSLNAFILLAVGITITLLAVFLIMFGTLSTLSMDVKGGALFLIGPFPLVLTFENSAPWLIALLPVLLILVPLLLFVTWLRRIKMKQDRSEV